MTGLESLVDNLYVTQSGRPTTFLDDASWWACFGNYHSNAELLAHYTSNPWMDGLMGETRIACCEGTLGQLDLTDLAHTGGGISATVSSQETHTGLV